MMADRESGVIAIRQKDRTNGWSWPLHPFQVIAWLFVVAIPLVYYGILASHLPHDVLIPGCVVSFVFLLVMLNRTLIAKCSCFLRSRAFSQLLSEGL